MGERVLFFCGERAPVREHLPLLLAQLDSVPFGEELRQRDAEALQMLSSVLMDGVVLRLKMFAMVDWDRPDAIARRYSLQWRSSISWRMRAFASMASHLLSWRF